MRHFAQFAPLCTVYQNRPTASACSNWLQWPPRVARVAGSNRQPANGVRSAQWARQVLVHACVFACACVYQNVHKYFRFQTWAACGRSKNKTSQATRLDSTRRDARAPNTSNFILFPNHNFCLSSVCCLCRCRCYLCCCCFCLDQFRCRCPMPNAGAGAGAAVESG